MITNDKELTGSQIISDFSFVWISLVHAAAVRCCQKLFDEVMVSYLGGGGLGCWGLGEVWFRLRQQETGNTNWWENKTGQPVFLSLYIIGYLMKE